METPSSNLIITYWFGSNNDWNAWWFKSSSSIDNEINTQFYTRMLQTHNDFDIDNYITATAELLIESIILLDQISRNIQRIQKNIPIDIYTNQAAELSILWINRNLHLDCEISWTVFALLPLRHTHHPDHFDKLLRAITEIEQHRPNLTIGVFFQKFKKHTIRQSILN
jgi:uncharacterized protein (DUF924 family)